MQLNYPTATANIYNLSAIRLSNFSNLTISRNAGGVNDRRALSTGRQPRTARETRTHSPCHPAYAGYISNTNLTFDPIEPVEIDIDREIRSPTELRTMVQARR